MDEVNLRTAMAQSCNVYFFDTARRMGIEPLVQWADRMEFGRVTGIDLPFEKIGTIPKADRDPAASGTESARQIS